MSDTTTLKKLLDKWDMDSNIDETSIGRESIRISKLHAKYLRWLVNHNMQVNFIKTEYAELKAKKFLWYNGKLSREELEQLNWPQWPNPAFKADIGPLLDSDKDLNAILEKKALQEEI